MILIENNTGQIKSKNITKVYWLIGLTFFLILFLITIHESRFKNTIDIFYLANHSNSLNGEKVEVLFGIGDASTGKDTLIDEGTIFKRHVSLQAATNIDNLENICINFIKDNRKVKIKKVVVRSGAFTIKTFLLEELLNKAKFVNAEEVKLEKGALTIMPMNEKSNCIFGTELVNEYKKSINKYANVSKYVVMGGAILVYLFFCWVIFRYDISNIFKNKLYIAGCCWIFIVSILVILMAGFSIGFGHPDEDVTAAAIDYYLKYSGLPRFQTIEALESFSNYGSTRLSELTIYYFLAGKVGWILKNIFHVFAYYRGLNVILFILMGWMFIKWGKKCPWMICGILFTPQLWYLFSYATSDAWDYFLSFVIIFNILNKESLFNRAIAGEKTWICRLGLIWQGLLFGLLYLGKMNYRLVFLLGFLILLIRLCQAPKKNQGVLLKKYVFILGIFVAVVAARYQLEDKIYQNQKNQQLAIIRDKIINEPQSKSLREEGTSLWEMIDKHRFLETTYKSFCGTYGWMTYQSPSLYYILVLGIYICLILAQMRFLISQSNKIIIAEYVFAWGLIALSFGVSLYHSWTSDFQAQGRYLMPALFCVMWIAEMIKGKQIEKQYATYGSILVVLSAFSYIYSGMSILI